MGRLQLWLMEERMMASYPDFGDTNDHHDQTVSTELTLDLNEIITVKIALNDNLEKASGWLFSLSVALGFVTIFSKFWIGGIAVVLAIIACLLLVYKSSINLMDQMDVNF